MLDTNAVIYLVNGRLAFPLPDGQYRVSIVTEIELLSFSDLSAAPKNLLSVPLVFTAEPDFYIALDKLLAPLISLKHSQVPFGDGH